MNPRSLCSPSLRVGRSGGAGRNNLVRIGDQQNQVCGLKKIGLVANGVGFESRTLANSGGIH